MTVRLAVIGTGHWGKNHARVLSEFAEDGVIESVTVCDLSAERAKAVADPLGVPWVTSIDDLLQRGVDAVVVATPTPTHHPIAKQLLSAGIHVLVEKPMAETEAQARELAELAENVGRVLMPGHLFRYHPSVVSLVRMLREGMLGDVRFMEVERRDWRAPRPDMGVVAALGVHELDLFSYLLGGVEPLQVAARLYAHARQGIEDHCYIHLAFPDGVHAHAVESWMSPHERRRKLTVVGTKGTVHVDFMQPDRLQWVPSAMEEVQGDLVATRGAPEWIETSGGEPLAQELRDFVHCVIHGGRPLSDVQGGVRAVRLVAQTMANDGAGSSLAGRPQPL